MKRRLLVLAAFVLGLLVGCQPNFVAPPWLTRVEPSAVTDSAAADALACGLIRSGHPTPTRSGT